MHTPPRTRARRYDKSAFEGHGDRADPSAWPVVKGPLQLVFFEGWMSGFRPVGREAAASVEPALAEVDAQLQRYEAAWDALVDSWLVIRIADPQVRGVCAGVVGDVGDTGVGVCTCNGAGTPCLTRTHASHRCCRCCRCARRAVRCTHRSGCLAGGCRRSSACARTASLA